MTSAFCAAGKRESREATARFNMAFGHLYRGGKPVPRRSLRPLRLTPLRPGSHHRWKNIVILLRVRIDPLAFPASEMLEGFMKRQIPVLLGLLGVKMDLLRLPTNVPPSEVPDLLGPGGGLVKKNKQCFVPQLLRPVQHELEFTCTEQSCLINPFVVGVILSRLQNLFGAAAVVTNAPAAEPSGPRAKRGELATSRQSESRGLVSETAVCRRSGGVDIGPIAPRRAANGGPASQAHSMAQDDPRLPNALRRRATPPSDYASVFTVAMGGEAAFCRR